MTADRKYKPGQTIIRQISPNDEEFGFSKHVKVIVIAEDGSEIDLVDLFQLSKIEILIDGPCSTFCRLEIDNVSLEMIEAKTLEFDEPTFRRLIKAVGWRLEEEPEPGDLSAVTLPLEPIPTCTLCGHGFPPGQFAEADNYRDFVEECHCGNVRTKMKIDQSVPDTPKEEAN